MLALLLIVAAAVGGELPEGNAIRDMTQGLRDFGKAVANSFGGGYTITTP